LLTFLLAPRGASYERAQTWISIGKLRCGIPKCQQGHWRRPSRHFDSLPQQLPRKPLRQKVWHLSFIGDPSSGSQNNRVLGRLDSQTLPSWRNQNHTWFYQTLSHSPFRNKRVALSLKNGVPSGKFLLLTPPLPPQDSAEKVKLNKAWKTLAHALEEVKYPQIPYPSFVPQLGSPNMA